jgi:hypothetical protein
MPEAENYSTKIVSDAKAAAVPSEAWGMAVGGEQEANASLPAGATFNTGALQNDLAPFGSRAAVPTSGAEQQ